MAWKEMNVSELAKSLGVDVAEAREKQRLMKLITTTRKAEKISQVALAKKVGVSQSRIAQIESGVGTTRISFDVLLSVLRALGFEFKIVSKRVA